MADIISLGIDTGGTYTDAVIFSDTRGVIAKAKALTTRHDLSEGIAGAADAALAAAQIDSREICLVSLSTTLATNALVEGQGQRVALVMIGFGEDDLAGTVSARRPRRVPSSSFPAVTMCMAAKPRLRWTR